MITSERLHQHADWLRDGTGKCIEAIAANLRGANLIGAGLRSADLSGADLSGANLIGADLRGAFLDGADLTEADIRGADIRGANINDANISGADLTGSDLTEADLIGADIRGANLSGANLRGADLSGADLRGANISLAIGNMREIKSAQFDRWAVTWSADVLAIGCQKHAIEKWRNADPRWIAAMDPGASDWWSRYGALVLQLIDASPATGMVAEVEP